MTATIPGSGIVPVLSLDSGTPLDLADALIDWSCVVITDHGVPAAARAAIGEVSLQFFDLPRERKEQLRWNGEGKWKGWLPQDAFPSKPGRVPDLLEKFEIQSPATFSLWPEQPAAFKEVWLDYYARCGDLASRLMRMLAEAMDLPAADLPTWTTEHYANLVVNDYPRRRRPPRPHSGRAPRHPQRGLHPTRGGKGRHLRLQRRTQPLSG